MKNEKSQKILLILFFIFLTHLSFRIYSYSSEYLSRYDPKYWKERIEKSQWGNRPSCMLTDPHINPKTCVWDDAYYQEHKNEKFVAYKEESIGDDGLYAYAGWEYIHGRDPTSFNAEIPPLGKYLIGLSTIIFGNQNIFALLSGIFVLISFFVLNKITFKDKLIAFIPVVLFSFDPLFYTQLRAPFLDILYLGFLILTFIFLFKEKFFLSMIFLGLTMATKASISTFVLITTSIHVYLLYMRNKIQIKKFILYLPISLGIFLFTYIVYFFQDHNIIDFLKVQKWIINFYATGVKGDPTIVFQILFTGNWPTWWGETLRVPEWHIGWPIISIVTIFYIFIFIKKYFLSVIYHSPFISNLSRYKFEKIKLVANGKWKMENKINLLVIWILIYLIFLTFIPVFPRYLLLVLPFMYTLFVWVLSKKIRWFS